MNIIEFKNLPVYENLLDLTEPKKGMKFLTGQTVVAQADSKEVGQIASYYEITDVNPSNPKIFSYTSRMVRLERPTITEE